MMPRVLQGEDTMAYTILRGGRVLDIAAGTAEPADILVEDDTIREIGSPGCPAPADAVEYDAARRLLHPGLVNAHTHGHGNLAKGMGDRWSLELLLSAAPWITGNRTAEDKYLSTQLGAVEMVMKGCTACYDLSFEWPLPSAEGLALAGTAYADVGMRAVIAPMVADRSFYEAIPGLMEALPRPLQDRVAELRLPLAEKSLAAIREALSTATWCVPRSRPRSRTTAPMPSSSAAPSWRASSASESTATSPNQRSRR
jgi:5-methylthioadenosine/S-adenosylhomocysteine deaminase